MATTGWLYATTSSYSGGGYSDPARGAPDGDIASLYLDTLTVGGYGLQAAIGSPPTSIDMVQVRVRMSAPFAGESVPADAIKVNGTSISPSATSLTTSLTDYTYTVPAGLRTWAALGSWSVTITQAVSSTDWYVDSVGVQVTYTTTVDHPMAATIPVVSAITATIGAGRALTAATPVVSATAANLDVLPGGLSSVVAVQSTTTATIGLLVGLAATTPTTTGTTATLSILAGLSATIPVTAGTTATIGRVEIQVVRAPARTVSELLAGSHRREDHVIILTGEHAGQRLPLLGGDLTLDEAADVHATGTLHLPPEPWLRPLLDPLAARTELAVVLAVRGDDDVLHTWQRAVVHATDMPTEVSSRDGLALSVSVADRSDWVRKAGMRKPYAGLGSVSILTHALRLVADRAPWLPIGDVTDPGYRSGTDLHVGGLGEDPWKLAVQLAWSVGQRLYVDAAGQVSTRSMLPADTVDARWVAGEDGCHIDSMSTSRSDADVCNVLGVPWEEAKPDDADEDWVPRSGVAWWEDATSSLGTQGPLGERVRAYSGDSSIIHSAGHALDVAVSHGVAQQGALVPLDFAVGCDPRLDVGSTVHVSRPELGVDEACRISVLRFGLGEPLMSGSMGVRRLLG